jgi:hypothetical protein
VFHRLHQGKSWDWATAYPHFPPLPNVYYLAEAPAANKTGKLDEFIARFRPKHWVDRELIKAMILTFFWGGPPGKRPQFVIVADEAGDKDAGRGTGKSTLAEYVSMLVGGCIDVDPNGNRERVLTNFLSPTAWHKRIALMDNLKAARFSNDMLERLVTRMEITGHRLYNGYASRPNYLTWIVTVNGAHFSTDEAQRSIVIRLERPTNEVKDWDAKTIAFIEQNREAIVADIRWHLEAKEAVTMTKIDRWGPWCLGILTRCKNPDKLLTSLSKRRDKIDGDKEETEQALDHLHACINTYFGVRKRGHDDEDVDDYDGQGNAANSRVWAPTAWFVKALGALKRDFGERQAQQFLPKLIPSGRLMKHKTKHQRGYLWIGKDVDPDNPPRIVDIDYQPEVPGQRRGS